MSTTDTSSGPGAWAELPLFPLNTVLCPDGLLELRIFEVRYLDLISRCMRERIPFGVVCLRSGAEGVARDDAVRLHEAGTLAELIEVDSTETNILSVRCRGTRRFALQATRQQSDGLWLGEAVGIADDPLVSPDASHAAVVKSLADAVDTLASQGTHPFLEPMRFDSAGWVANRWCDILPLHPDVKQRLMTMVDPIGRLDVIDSLMRSNHEPH